VTILQAWLVVGIPGLVLALALFYGPSRLRTTLGYAVLLVVFGLMATVDRGSAAFIGGIAALLYAAGRGGEAESRGENTSTIAVPEQVRRPVRPTRPSTES
jgi:hypothetical protein